MQLFGIPNCNTVKKARDWLDQHNIVYTFHDFKKNGVSQALLENWLSQMPWEKLINRAGMTWRNLSDAEKAVVVDATSAISLMLAKPSIIKRPILVKDDKILALGFVESSYQTALNK